MRRYSLFIFLFIFTINITVLIYQEKHFEEKSPRFVSADFLINHVQISDNYNMYVSDKVAILDYNREDMEVIPGTTVLVKGQISSLKAYLQRGYANYLRSKGYNYLLKASVIEIVEYKPLFNTFIYKQRNCLGEYIDNIYRADSPFIKALIYGDRFEMNKSDTDIFSKTGISHLLAISGFHIGIISAMMLLVVKKLNSKMKYSIVLFLLVFYVIFTGARPSAIRAVVFYFLYIMSIFLCKRYDVISCAYILSSLLMTLNPYILYDIGFVLSFTAVVSIGLFYQPIKSIIKKIKFVPNYIIGLISMTLSAQLLTLPLTYYYFQRISIVSLISNLVSVPLVTLSYPLIMVSLFLNKIPIIGELSKDIVVLLKNLLYGFNYKISEYQMSYVDFESSNIYTTIVIYIIIFVAYHIYATYILKENNNELQGFIEKY